MTGQVCLKDGPDDEAVNSGVAKRAANFERVAARAAAFKPPPTRQADIKRAFNYAVPELKHGAHRLLGFYLDHLSMENISAGRTSVWPGAWTAENALGVSPAQLRRYKAELEEAGYIIRKYDHRNRPLNRDAIDLCPFLLLVPSLVKKIDERLAGRRAELDEQRAADAKSALAESSAQARMDERLNNHLKDSESCTVSRLENGKEDVEITTQATSLYASGEVEEAEKIIQDVLKISPKLRKSLAYDNRPLTLEEAARRLYTALPELFPNASQRSMGSSVRIAVNRYGARVFECLAASIEDPKVRSPERYFGWLATRTEPLDLTINLARIARENPPPVEIDFPPERLGIGVATELTKRMSVCTYNSWFGTAQTRFRQEVSTLIVETTTKFARNWIEDNFGPQLDLASRNIGFDRFKVVHVSAIDRQADAIGAGEAGGVAQILSASEPRT